MRSRRGSMPRGAVLAEARAAVGDEPAALQHVVRDHRHEDVELEVARQPGDAHGHVVAHHLAAAMVSASACVGLTLPGMIELPGSFSGIAISPMPQRGPEAKPAARRSRSC